MAYRAHRAVGVRVAEGVHLPTCADQPVALAVGGNGWVMGRSRYRSVREQEGDWGRAGSHRRGWCCRG